jgi:tetratricopeptide (TPR) repeat protein
MTRSITFPAIAMIVFVSAAPCLVDRMKLNVTLIQCLRELRSGHCGISSSVRGTRWAYHAGISALRSGRPAEAIDPLRAQLDAQPNDELAAWYLGTAYLRVGRKSDALHVWRKQHMAEVFATIGRRDGSITDLQTAIELGENNPETFYKLGDALWEQRRERDARNPYARGVQLDESDHLNKWLARGRTAEVDEDWPQAQRIYETAIGHNSEDSRPYIRGADIYRLHLHRPAEAMSSLTRCARNTNSMDCFIAAGNTALAIGDIEVALRWGLEAQRRFPSSSAPLLFLASAWHAAGNEAKADTAYGQAEAIDPGNFWIPLYRGDLAAREGHLIAAVAFYNAAARLNPSSPAVYLAMGTAYRRLGRSQSAAAAYRRALALAPDSKEAADSLATIASNG